MVIFLALALQALALTPGLTICNKVSCKLYILILFKRAGINDDLNNFISQLYDLYLSMVVLLGP